MIARWITLDGWRFYCFFATSRYDSNRILRLLDRCGASRSILRRVAIKMRLDKLDSGFTYTNPYRRRTVMVVGRSSSGAEFLNSFVHELRHLADDYGKANRILLDGEGIAYFSGDMAYNFADIVCALTCDHCRRNTA